MIKEKEKKELLDSKEKDKKELKVKNRNLESKDNPENQENQDNQDNLDNLDNQENLGKVEETKKMLQRGKEEKEVIEKDNNDLFIILYLYL